MQDRFGARSAGANVRRARLVLGFWCAIALLGGFLAAPARAEIRHFVLDSSSSISAICAGCSVNPKPEPLSGSFDVTVLPVEQPYGVAAITNLQLNATSFTITGNGFWQRLGLQRQAMVLDARINDGRALLTSGRRQTITDGRLSIVLSSGRSTEQTYILVISAQPVEDQEPDADGDRVPDAGDNCKQDPNHDQADEDHDGVGDVCDACPQTTSGALVTTAGCSLEQVCPCAAPVGEEAWQSQGEYVRCVARAVRGLRRNGTLSRSEAMRIIRGSARSGCGRTILALR